MAVSRVFGVVGGAAGFPLRYQRMPRPRVRCEPGPRASFSPRSVNPGNSVPASGVCIVGESGAQGIPNVAAELELARFFAAIASPLIRCN